QHRETEGHRRQQQQGRVHGQAGQVEYLGGRRPTGVVGAQHGVAREQRGEDEAVAHQVDPEPEQGSVVSGRFLVAEERRGCATGSIDSRAVHARAPWVSACQLPVCSNSRTSSAWMWKSRWLLKVWAMVAAMMPTKDAAASHQMYQTRPKQQRKDSTPMTAPAAVFFGMWIGWKPSSGRR